MIQTAKASRERTRPYTNPGESHKRATTRQATENTNRIPVELLPFLSTKLSRLILFFIRTIPLVSPRYFFEKRHLSAKRRSSLWRELQFSEDLPALLYLVDVNVACAFQHRYMFTHQRGADP